MAVPNFIKKYFPIRIYTGGRRGGGQGGGAHPPGTWSDKNTPGQIGLNIYESIYESKFFKYPVVIATVVLKIQENFSEKRKSSLPRGRTLKQEKHVGTGNYKNVKTSKTS